uniref:Kelch repeat and BTB domain-containing protein n=1 Tax=Ascaris suum TaxID=6253 RepID=F1L1M8_ASCSU
MEPVDTFSESLRDTISETGTNNWEIGVLEYRRQLLQASTETPFELPLDPDYTYCISSSGNNASKKLAQMENNDGVIVLGGNKTVKLDPFEFAHISPYFRAAFFGHFEEAKTKLIMFRDPEPNAFLNCLAFIRQLLVDEKGITATMDLDKALEMLDMAAYLIIEPVLEVISNIIVKTVPASKLLAVYHKAENRHPPLAQRLWNMIVREFDKLILNETFIELTEEELCKLLQDKHLNIRRSDETSVVRSWIEANKWNGNCVEHLQLALAKVADDTGFYDGGVRLPNSVLIASGGWSNAGPTIVVETLDMPTKRWIQSDVKLFETPRAYHGVVNTGEDLYTIGGFNGAEYYRSTRKFNLKTRQLVEVAPMYDQRCYVACGLLDNDRIIAIGGYDNRDRLRTAEILHIPTNQWRRIAEMSVKRSDGHCVVYDGKVYAVGGFDGVNCHATIEIYDVITNRWLTMKQLMRSRRSGVRAAVIEGAICVCGGFDGSVRLSSCEFIDIREGQWHLLRPMNNPRSNFGIEIFNNQVVVAGGYAGVVGTINEVEAFDFRADAWTEMPSMGMRRSAVYLTRIDNHEIIEKLVRPDTIAQ